MSRSFRITLVILGTLVALSMAAMGVMSTSWFRRALEHRIIGAIEGMTGARVEVQEFRFRPVTLQVILHGLVMHGNEPPGAPPLFSARTLVVRLRPANLLQREIRLASLDWDGAQVHLQVKADGSTNLPEPVIRYEAGRVMDQLIDLRIGRATLAHSTFFWNDQLLNLDLDAQELAILLRFRRGSRYEGTLSASTVTTRMPGRSLVPFTFATRFVLSRNEIAVTSITLQSRGISGQGSFTFHPAPEPQGYFSLQTNLDAAALNSLFRLPGLKNGALRIEGQGIYRHGEIIGQGRIQSRQLLFRGPQFNAGPLEVTADYSLKGRKVAIANLTVHGWEGSITGEGEIDASGPAPQFQIRARLHNISLGPLLRSSTIQPLLIAQLHPASLLRGVTDLTWSGEFEKAKAEFELQLSAPATSPPGSTPVSGMMRGALETNHGLSVSLSDSSFDTPNSSLRARGTMATSMPGNRSPSSLEIHCSTSQFEEWRPVLEALVESTDHWPISLKSRATFSGEVRGSIESPEIQGSLHLGEFKYRDWTWDGLDATLAARPEFFQISSARLSHGTSVLALQAAASLRDWRVTRTSMVRFSAVAQRAPLEGLKAAFGIDYPVGGRLSGRLAVTGTPPDLEGTGTINVEAGNLAGETFDSLSASVRVSKSIWSLDPIEMLKDQGKMTAKVWVEPSSRSVTCQLRGAGFSLSKFKRFSLPFLHSFPHQQLEGMASFDLQGGGTPEKFHFHSKMLVQDITAADTRVGDLHVELDDDGQTLRVQGTGSGPGGIFSLSGEAKVAGEWPFQLQGQYASFRVDPWGRLLVNRNLGGEVIAGGFFKASGALRNSSALEMQSDIQTLEVIFPSLKWRNEHPVELRFASNQLSARPFRMQGPSTNLIIDGSLGLAGKGSLSLTAQGTADATLLNVFDPNLRASGHSQMKLRVSGQPARPQLNGTVEIQDVSLNYEGLPFHLSNLNGGIRLEGERGTIESLRGVSGGGSVTLSGFFTLTLPPRIELRAALDQIRMRYPPAFTSILSGNLRLAGTPQRAQVQGDLVVRQVLAGETKNWLAQIMESNGPFEESQPAAASALADAVRLNIRVTSAAPVRLETQDMQLTADVDVRMQGSMVNPVPVGTIHFLSGEAIFRGNRFTLNRGDLNLTNPFRTQATLDLEAQTRVQRYNLTVDVSGPLGRLRMSYRSDPPLPSEDVISLLALGYSQQQQQASTSGLVSSFTRGNSMQSVGASALLSQALSSQMTGRIQRLFGVSRIKIDPNVGLPGITSGARVTVEQRVTRDLTLTYVTNTASSQYRIIQFEWNVGENMSLLGVRDQNGILGVELRFRRRFK